MFAAGVSRVQGLQLLEHCAPCGLFLLRVLHLRDGLATGRKYIAIQYHFKSAGGRVAPLSCFY